jgi:hypothetical protein
MAPAADSTRVTIGKVLGAAFQLARLNVSQLKLPIEVSITPLDDNISLLCRLW